MMLKSSHSSFNFAGSLVLCAWPLIDLERVKFILTVALSYNSLDVYAQRSRLNALVHL
jgi:hypothetical protein